MIKAGYCHNGTTGHPLGGKRFFWCCLMSLYGPPSPPFTPILQGSMSNHFSAPIKLFDGRCNLHCTNGKSVCSEDTHPLNLLIQKAEKKKCDLNNWERLYQFLFFHTKQPCLIAPVEVDPTRGQGQDRDQDLVHDHDPQGLCDPPPLVVIAVDR